MDSQPRQAIDLEAFQKALTLRVEKDLPSWYGNQARLEGAPSFQERHWSFFFRYQVRVSETKSTAVLVKLRHRAGMTVTEAAVDEIMKEEIRDEYESLRRIESVFSGHADSSLFATIRPLAIYDDINAFAMGQADIRTLKSIFHAPGMRLDAKACKRFESFLERTGRWLRIYHDNSGEAGEGPLFPKTLYEDNRERLERIQNAAPRLKLGFAKEFMDDLYHEAGQSTVQYRTLHNNFSINNVFVTGDERICSFDTHNTPGSPYYDFGKFLIDLETSNQQALTRGRLFSQAQLKSFNDAFLGGYFHDAPADRDALRLYYLLILFEKWDRHESKRLKSSGTNRVLYLFGAPYIQSYYMKLLRRQVN